MTAAAPSPPPLTETEPIIRVDGLTAAYGDTVILKDVSFEVMSGEVFVILGGSGCGKSTLLKHMIGLYEPAAGRVLIEGRDLAGAFGRERRAILRRIGVLYQSGALFGSMTLLENIMLPLEELTTLPEAARERIARAKLELVGLADAADKAPAELSGGMKKRAGLARALALDPPVLFLDEPSAGLDPVTGAQLDALILKLAKSLGLTFVVVTHELESIKTIATRALMLDKETKGIIALGPIGELTEGHPHPKVRQFFERIAEDED